MRLACIALALTIAAGSPPERSEPTEAQILRLKMGAIQMVLGGLVQFYTEWPSGRAPCNEQKLFDVSAVAIVTLRADYSKDTAPEHHAAFMWQIADAALKTADIYRANGCPKQARDLYEAVTHLDGPYRGLRARAAEGIGKLY